MSYKAVIFDLYGTLVGNFSRKIYDQVQVKIAEILNVDFSEYWKIKAETIKDRSLGYLNLEQNISVIGNRLNVDISKSQILKIHAIENKFTKNSLIPKPEVLNALGKLKCNGLLIGLITNCNPSVPLLFQQSKLARYIDVPVFSCEERLKKPSPRIFEIACKRLNVLPQQCIYVGDGSSEELTGASSVGMYTILKHADLTDVYDPHRPDVQSWNGISINEISELCEIFNKLT